MAKKSKPPAAAGGSVFDRSDDQPDTDSDQVQTSPATAAAVPAPVPPTPPDGDRHGQPVGRATPDDGTAPKAARPAVICNACSTADLQVKCEPVAPGWVRCPLCKVKQRDMSSLRAAMKARGGKPRAAR